MKPIFFNQEGQSHKYNVGIIKRLGQEEMDRGKSGFFHWDNNSYDSDFFVANIQPVKGLEGWRKKSLMPLVLRAME